MTVQILMANLILKQFNGKLSISSSVQTGTVIAIEFPMVCDNPSAGQDITHAANTIAKIC